MSANWSLLMQVNASVGVLLTVAVFCILSFIKEVNMKRAIAKAVILTVGTALLGRPVGGMFPTSEGREVYQVAERPFEIWE